MTDKTALVTGGARRIGAAICRQLHAHGMQIVIHYHQSARDAESLCVELNTLRPDSAHMLCADLSTTAAASDLVDKTLAITGRLDVLVNNASRFYPTPLAELGETQWQDMMSVNLQAPLQLAQAAADELARRRGCIINLTDIHASQPLKDHLLYSVSKAGLVTLTQALALEMAPAVRVNAVAPGAILWPENMPATEQQEILKKIPLQKAGESNDIAAAVCYLALSANYTTGQVLVVDGGHSLSA